MASGRVLALVLTLGIVTLAIPAQSVPKPRPFPVERWEEMRAKSPGTSWYVAPPTRNDDGETVWIFEPLERSTLDTACDSTNDCRKAASKACEQAGHGDEVKKGTVEVEDGKSCTAQCNGGCNVNGECPQVLIECNPDEVAGRTI